MIADAPGVMDHALQAANQSLFDAQLAFQILQVESFPEIKIWMPHIADGKSGKCALGQIRQAVGALLLFDELA